MSSLLGALPSDQLKTSSQSLSLQFGPLFYTLSPRPRRKTGQAQPSCSTKGATLDITSSTATLSLPTLGSRFSCGAISSTDHEGRQFWLLAAEREDIGLLVHADEKLPAFVELEVARKPLLLNHWIHPWRSTA